MPQTRIEIGIFKPFIANGTQNRVPFDALLMMLRFFDSFISLKIK